MDVDAMIDKRKRQCQHEGSLWNRLHQDPFNLIAKNIQSSPTANTDICSMRLVSPSWRAAVQLSPLSIRLALTEKSSLEGISKALLCLSSVTATCKREDYISLGPLSNSPQLTQLKLTGKDTDGMTGIHAHVELKLPPALGSLSLDAISPYSIASHGNLTQLHYQWEDPKRAGIHVPKMLRSFPALKELYCGASLGAQYRNAYEEWLELCVPEDTDGDIISPALQKLHFSATMLRPDWMARAFTSTQGLQHLQLDSCFYAQRRGVGIRSCTTLQSLTLKDADLRLLGLAPDSLRSLSFRHRDQTLDPADISRMTGLTRLELFGPALGSVEDCSVILGMGLLELRLIGPPARMAASLVPGPLGTPMKLHVEETDRSRGRSFFQPSSWDSPPEPSPSVDSISSDALSSSEASSSESSSSESSSLEDSD